MTKRFIYALIALIAAWLAFTVSDIALLWQGMVIATLMPVYSIFSYFRRDGTFSPVNVVLFISFVSTFVTLIWLVTYIGHILRFFSIPYSVSLRDIVVLAREQLLFTSCLFLAFGIVHAFDTRVSVQAHIRLQKFKPPHWLWTSSYIIGFVAVAGLYVVAGPSFAALADKALRNSHHAVWVFLQYFGYVGALLWFTRNQHMKRTRRYSGLVLLLLPMLATGDRGGIFATIISAISIDEQTGLHIKAHVIAPAAIALSSIFVIYAMVRGSGDNGQFLSTFFKDISMQYAFVVAHGEHILDNKFRPEVMLSAIAPLVPSRLDLLPSVIPPNRYITNALFPNSIGFTASMGLYGEAHYMFPYYGVIPYYLIIGLIITLYGTVGRRLPIVLTGILVGASYRIVRGGFLTGISFMIEMLVPMFVMWLTWVLLSNVIVKRRGLKKVVMRRAAVLGETPNNSDAF